MANDSVDSWLTSTAGLDGGDAKSVAALCATHGVTSVSDVLALSRADLVELKLAEGPRDRILQAIDKSKAKPGPSPPPAAAVPAPKAKDEIEGDLFDFFGDEPRLPIDATAASSPPAKRLIKIPGSAHPPQPAAVSMKKH